MSRKFLYLNFLIPPESEDYSKFNMLYISKKNKLNLIGLTNVLHHLAKTQIYQPLSYPPHPTCHLHSTIKCSHVEMWLCSNLVLVSASSCNRNVVRCWGLTVENGGGS